MKGDILDFIHEIEDVSEKLGVDIAFLPRKGVFGFFDANKKRIEVSVEEADWLLTLAHEAGHMMQWSEGLFPEVWPADGPYELFDDWLDKKVNPKPRQLLKAVRTIQACERDAERRAVNWAKAYGLTQDLQGYIGRAWCNVMGYELGRRHRFWWEDGKPYPWDVKEIRERLPKRLPYVSEFHKLDTSLEVLIMAHCKERT